MLDPTHYNQYCQERFGVLLRREQLAAHPALYAAAQQRWKEAYPDDPNPFEIFFVPSAAGELPQANAYAGLAPLAPDQCCSRALNRPESEVLSDGSLATLLRATIPRQAAFAYQVVRDCACTPVAPLHRMSLPLPSQHTHNTPTTHPQHTHACTHTHIQILGVPSQEKGRVMRLAVTLMGKAAGRESILPARISNHCRSLVPLGRAQW